VCDNRRGTEAPFGPGRTPGRRGSLGAKRKPCHGLDARGVVGWIFNLTGGPEWKSGLGAEARRGVMKSAPLSQSLGADLDDRCYLGCLGVLDMSSRMPGIARSEGCWIPARAACDAKRMHEEGASRGPAQ